MAVHLDKTFLAQQEKLRQDAATNSAAVLADGQRQWQIPVGLTETPLDVPALNKPFSRAALNALYPSVFLLGGSEGDAMACRVQGDYLSAQERAFRMRHASTIRCLVHAAGRRVGHGHPLGPLNRVVTYVQDLIVAGAHG